MVSRINTLRGEGGGGGKVGVGRGRLKQFYNRPTSTLVPMPLVTNSNCKVQTLAFEIITPFNEIQCTGVTF